MEPRAEVKSFAGEMEKQLGKNEHKGGWGNCDRRFLLKELKDGDGEGTQDG